MGCVNLREGSDPYIDLKIECDEVTFYVHRYVVCSKSKVLAKECENGVKEADITKVEHAIFDALTLERMLVFLYQGDYNLPKSDAAVARPNQPNKEAQAITRYESEQDISAANVLYMHANMYHVALYYDIADLQALALAKFKASNTSFTMSEFLHMGKVIYQNPESNVGLRQELVLKLVNSDLPWLADRQFRQDLVDVGHNAFTVDVWTASFEKSFEREAVLKTSVESQHESDVQLHSALEKMMADQTKASKTIKELQRKLTEAEAAKAHWETECKSLKAQAGENFLKASKNNVALQERDKLLAEKCKLLEAETNRADRCSELVNIKGDQIKEKDLKIQEETRRANDNHATCVKKDAEISQKDKQLKTEKEQFDKYYALYRKRDSEARNETMRANATFELCGQKDHIIKEKEMALAPYKEKANFFDHAQKLLNEWDRCSWCGVGLWPWLCESNKGNVYVRCRSCNRANVHVNR